MRMAEVIAEIADTVTTNSFPINDEQLFEAIAELKTMRSN